ncbi:MAG TPA: DUF2807 domain-containing protein [Clostridiales bacterium]|jgi:hypothetical protein|nr:DUF2807 domain-containing protein [Clostridiales bacterium]
MKKILHSVICAALAAAAVLFLLSGCVFSRAVEGDKNVLPRTFSLDAGAPWIIEIADIDLDWARNIKHYITLDESLEDSVVITTDENIFNSLKVDIEGNTVKIKGDREKRFAPSEFEIIIGVPTASLSADGGFVINASIPSSTPAKSLALTINGGAEINLACDMLESLTLDVNGAAEANLEGSSSALKANIDGAASLHAFPLQTETAEITINGAASAEVSVSGSLKAAINGAGDIKYKGEPQVEQTINGAGSVVPYSG